MNIVDEGTTVSAAKHDGNAKAKAKKSTPTTDSHPASTSNKPITSTALRSEHLDAAQMLLKAATVCALKEDEECENTAICVERVVADLIALTAAVAKALNSALDCSDTTSLDPTLVKRWCEFYSSDLLPQTKTMMKKMSPILDAYGLFLPSRIGASVSPELLEKGLSIIVMEGGNHTTKADNIRQDSTSTTADMIPNKNEQDDLKVRANDKDGMDSEEDEDDADDINEDIEQDEAVVEDNEEEEDLTNEEYEYYDEDEDEL